MFRCRGMLSRLQRWVLKTQWDHVGVVGSRSWYALIACDFHVCVVAIFVTLCNSETAFWMYRSHLSRMLSGGRLFFMVVSVIVDGEASVGTCSRTVQHAPPLHPSSTCLLYRVNLTLDPDLTRSAGCIYRSFFFAIFQMHGCRYFAWWVCRVLDDKQIPGCLSSPYVVAFSSAAHLHRAYLSQLCLPYTSCTAAGLLGGCVESLATSNPQGASLPLT